MTQKTFTIGKCNKTACEKGKYNVKIIQQCCIYTLEQLKGDLMHHYGLESIPEGNLLHHYGLEFIPEIKREMNNSKHTNMILQAKCILYYKERNDVILPHYT